MRPVRAVALLRGINVGRAKRIAMADLRALMAELGFDDVRTLLNSGNIVFTDPKGKPAQASGRIERAIADQLGVSTQVLVITADELGEKHGSSLPCWPTRRTVVRSIHWPGSTGALKLWRWAGGLPISGAPRAQSTALSGKRSLVRCTVPSLRETGIRS